MMDAAERESAPVGASAGSASSRAARPHAASSRAASATPFEALLPNGTELAKKRGDERAAVLNHAMTLPGAFPFVAGPIINASKDDGLLYTAKVAPGGTINYTVVISNTGDAAATGVTFADTIDTHTTLVGGSITVTPIAATDTYSSIGNVGLNVPAARGVLKNDIDPLTGDNSGITVTTTGNINTTGGGTVTMNADGSFTYEPAPGFEGTGATADSFTYTASKAGKTDTGTVKIDVSTVIWFVKTGAAANGNGTLNKPFNCLVGLDVPATTTCFSNSPNDQANDAIFIYSGSYSDNNPLILLSGQKVFGQGSTQSLQTMAGIATIPTDSNTLPSTGGAYPVITSTSNGINLNSGNTLRGFTIGDTGGVTGLSTDISGSAFGRLTVREVLLNGTGRALNLDNGSLDTTFDSITVTAATSLEGVRLKGVANATSPTGSFSSGGVTVSGAHTDGIYVESSTADISFGNTSLTSGTGTTNGVQLLNNTGGTRTFGTLGISGGSNIGFLSTNGGAVTVTGATTVTNPASTGISIASSTAVVSFAATTVNKSSTAGNGVGFNTSSGATTFATLAITVNNGTGLFSTENGGAINVTNGVGSSITSGGASPAIAAIDISKSTGTTPIGLNFASISSINSAGRGARFDHVSGSFSCPTTTVSNPTGAGIEATNSTAGFAFGTTSVTGSGSTGILLTNNTGGVSFGDMDITPDTNQRAFVATHSLAATTSGTITATSGDITTSGARAIEVTGLDNTHRTPLSMSLTSLTTSGATQSVQLTETSGSFTVTGTTNVNTRTGTGLFFSSVAGTVSFSTTNIPNASNAGGYGIRVQNSPASVTFSAVTISNANQTVPETLDPQLIPTSDGDGDGIFLSGNTGSFTISGTSTISSADGDGIDLRNSSSLNLTNMTITSPGSANTDNIGHGIRLYNLSGTSAINNCSVSDWGDVTAHNRNGLNLLNNNVSLTSLTLSGCTFSNSPEGGDGVGAEMRGSSGGTITIKDLSGDRGVFTGLLSDGVDFGTIGGSTGTVNLNVQNCDFSNAATLGGGGIDINAVGIGGATVNYSITGNTFTDLMRPASNAGAINLTTGCAVGCASNNDGPRLLGTIANNTLDQIQDARGISVIADTFAKELKTVIDNNSINRLTDGNKPAIFVDTRNTVPTSNVTVSNNNIGLGTGGYSAGNNEAVGVRSQDSAVVKTLITGNTIKAAANFEVLRVRAGTGTTSMDATVTNNNLEDTNGGTHREYRISSNAPGTDMCANLTGNNSPSGASAVIELDRGGGGAISVPQASTAAISTANNGLTVTTPSGAPTFNGGACATVSLLTLPFDAPVNVTAQADTIYQFVNDNLLPLQQRLEASKTRRDQQLALNIPYAPPINDSAVAPQAGIINASYSLYAESGAQTLSSASLLALTEQSSETFNAQPTGAQALGRDILGESVALDNSAASSTRAVRSGRSASARGDKTAMLSHAMRVRPRASALAAAAFVGETVNVPAVGAPVATFTLPEGKTVTITFSVTVNNPPNLTGVPPATPQVSNQGHVVPGAGANFSDVATHDPDTASPGGAATATKDATITLVDLFDVTTTVDSNNNPSDFGESVTFTATVTPNPANATPVTGTVQFFDNGNPMTCDEGGVNGVRPISAPTCTTSNLSATTNPPPPHVITAQYSGDGNYEPGSPGTLSGGQTVIPCASNPTVTSADDDGDTDTLRYAITNICSAPNNKINFNITGAGPHTITLTTGQIAIDKDVVINNASGESITIDANHLSRIFKISSGKTATIKGLNIINGQPALTEAGGGIFNEGTLNLINSTVSGNSTRSNNGGGGIYSFGGTLNLINSTVSGNSAHTHGGGIFPAGATVTIINSTITNNHADSDNSAPGLTDDVGGGIGGGIYAGGSTVTVHNSIVAGNFNGDGVTDTPDDISGTLQATSSFNLIGDAATSGGLQDKSVDAAHGNIVGNAGSGTINIATVLNILLASNGGTTRTHALVLGSPALDAGSNSNLPADTYDTDDDANVAETLPVDQRGTGFARKLDSDDSGTTQTVDIGAYEADPTLENITDKETPEDTPLAAFIVNVGDAATSYSLSAVATTNPGLVSSIVITDDTTATPKLAITPTANESGVATITVTIEKTIGGTTQSMTDTFDFTVTGVNDAPVATDDPLSSVAEDSGVRTIPFTDLTGNDSKGPTNESGQALTITAVSNAVGGAVQIVGTDVKFTPTDDFNGAASFDYTVQDNGQSNGVDDFKTDTGHVTFTITEVNDVPVPANDTLSNVAEGSGTRTIPFTDLTTNDSRGAANESTQTLEIISVGNAVGGSVSIVGTDVKFTPTDADFNGAASFEYTVRDNGTTNGANDFKDSTTPGTASFSITEVNDAPVADDDALSSIAEDSGVLTIPFADLTGDDSKGPANESGQALTISAVNNAVGGSVSIVGTDVKFSPTTDFNGAASFDYTVRDNGTTAGVDDFKTDEGHVTFTITEVNDAPVADDDALSSINEDSGVRTIPFSDLLNGDTTGPANENTQTLAITLVDNAVGGTVQIVGTDVLFTPGVNFNGAASFDYTVRDNGQTNGVDDFKTDVGHVTFSIIALADAPVATPDNLNTNINTLSSDIVLTPSADDTGDGVTHFKITNLQNGTLFQHDGTTGIPNDSFITLSQGAAGVRFKPDLNLSSPGSTFGFDVQASIGGVTTSVDSTHVTITVSCDASFAVLNTDDASNGSLRNAISRVCPGATITFDSVAFDPSGSPYTITLASTLAIDKDLTITGPTASRVIINGGGHRVFNITSGDVNISNLTITGGATSGSDGAGLLNQSTGTVTIRNSTFTANVAGGGGNGGAIATSPGTLNLYNSTLSNNTGSFGGGIYNAAGTVNILNSTIYGNHADPGTGQGGGIYNSSGTVKVKNSIVTDNTAPTNNNVAGTITDQGNNLIDTPAGVAALAYNGGPTQTHALLIGSPALDAGDNSVLAAAGLTFDQRGFERTRDSADSGTTQTVDIGAYEADPTLENITDKETPEDTPLAAFIVNVGDAATAYTLTAVATTNPGLVSSIVITDDTTATPKLAITPAGDESGTATITVTIEKTIGGTTQSMTDTFDFKITDVNDIPVPADDVIGNVAEDSATRTIPFSALTANDSRGEASESGQALIVKTVSNAVGGTVSIVGTDVKFTPAADFNGAASFKYTVEDNGQTNGVDDFKTSLVAGTVTFTITEVNDTPTAVDDTLADVGEDSGQRTIPFADLTTNDSEGPADESGQTLIVKTVSNAVGGTVSISGGNVLFTPALNFSGAASFKYTAQDDGTTNGAAAPKTSAAATVTFNVIPQADVPLVSNATTSEDVQTASGLVITPNAVDGGTVTHFKITNITGGTLYQNNGTTPIANNSFITLAQGAAGLKFTPTANLFSPVSSFGFQVQAATSSVGAGLSNAANALITVGPVADTPSVTNATTNEDTQTASGLVIARNAVDSTEVTHFKISGITGGTLYQNNGTTPIANDQFITFAQGAAGLKFTPALNSTSNGSFQVQASRSATNGGLGGSPVAATITISPVADTPSVTNATTNEDTQTASGLVITRNAADGAEVTYFKISGITGGTLYQNNGTTPIVNNSFITLAQGAAGLKFTPALNSTSNGSFQVQASRSATNGGLGGALATATITVLSVNDTPTLNAIANLAVNEDSPAKTINLAGISAGGGEAQTLTVTATSDNTGLIPNPVVTYTSPNATGTLTFTPVAGQSGTALITVTVKDNGGTANGATDSFQRTFTVTVNNGNDAPVNHVPGAQTTGANTPLTFNGANSNLISITDDAAAAALLKITLTATNGKVKLSRTTGLVFSVGSGASVATATFTGTLANINAALDGLIFTPTTGFQGAASVALTTNDQGATGAGGARTDSDTIPVTVSGQTLQFTSDQLSVGEAGLHARITVTRSAGFAGTASVDYVTSDLSALTNCNVNTGNASARCDYTAVGGTLTFAAGQFSKTFDIPIVNDVYVEGAETLTLTLSNPVGGGLGPIPTATLTIQDDDLAPGAPNPIDGHAFFVRQLYMDILNREPEASGQAAWLAIINNCPAGDTSCDDVAVALGFFRSPEFFDRSYFIYRVYESTLGRKPTYAEYQQDVRKVSGYLTDAELETRKRQFILDFMQRTAFTSRYNSITDEGAFVDALLQAAGVTLANRNQLVSDLQQHHITRADAIRAVADSQELSSKFFNEGFVVIGYFAFLRRDPDAMFQGWIKALDEPPVGSSQDDSFRTIIGGLIHSAEYRARFGTN
jgi:hypothetical protein